MIAFEMVDSTQQRSLVVISLSEAVLLNGVGWIIWCCYNPDMQKSPRMDEWYGWAPEGLRFWLLAVSTSMFLAPVLCIFPLTVYSCLPDAAKTRIRLRISLPGSPPLVGAIIFFAMGIALVAAVGFVAYLED